MLRCSTRTRTHARTSCRNFFRDALLHTRTHKCGRLLVPKCTYARTHTKKCSRHVCLMPRCSTHTHTHTQWHTHACTHTRIHTYTHTHARTHSHAHTNVVGIFFLLPKLMLKSSRAGLFSAFKYTCVTCEQSNIRTLVRSYESKCIWELVAMHTRRKDQNFPLTALYVFQNV